MQPQVGFFAMDMRSNGQLIHTICMLTLTEYLAKITQRETQIFVWSTTEHTSRENFAVILRYSVDPIDFCCP